MEFPNTYTQLETFSFDSETTYEAVMYADGGANPNPGFAGYGIHGYFYIPVTDSKFKEMKKPVVIANHFMEFFNTVPNAVDYAYPTTKGYFAFDQKTFEKEKKTWVAPVAYLDISHSFFEPQTNNVAELSALEKCFSTLLLLIQSGVKLTKVKFILDSQYVLNTVEKFGDAYRENGWVTSQGTPAKNREIIEPLLELRDALKTHKVGLSFEWCKGHQGELGNGMADYQASVAVKRARAMDNPNRVRWHAAKNYWDQDIDRHPLMTMKRTYINRVNAFNKEGQYYSIEPASTDLMIGKRDVEAYSITRLLTPDPYIETVKEAQSKFGQEENRVIMIRNERLYTRFIQKYIREHGEFCMGPSVNNKTLKFLDDSPVAVEHTPPTLFYRVVEAFSLLETLLDGFEVITSNSEMNSEDPNLSQNIIVHDITSEFYTVEDKKTGKQTVPKMVLKPEFNVGYKNHSLPVKEVRGGVEYNFKVALALGMDLPGRNYLKHLEDHLPKIYLLTWSTEPDVLQYACVIDCKTGNSIWSNYFCNRLFLKALTSNGK